MLNQLTQSHDVPVVSHMVIFALSGKKPTSDAAQDNVGVTPAAAPAAMATSNKVMATPAVRRIANEHNVSTWDYCIYYTKISSNL